MRCNSRAGWVTGLLLAASLVVALPSITLAYTATVYSSSKTFTVGTLMAINNSGQPVPAIAGSNYVGVVTKQSDASVEIADSGIVQVFVAKDDTGIIKSGSKIGFSSVAGIGALLNTSSTQIGVANENVDASSSKWETITIKMNDDAAEQNIRVALVEVRLAKGDGVGSANSSGELIGTVQRAAENIVGHSVALWQIVFAAILGIGGLILAFGLIFSSGREGIMSIGRNPMASKVILHGMWRVSITSIAIMMAGLLFAYLILKVGSV